MELLIPGIILVGFMAWLSTRIKRSAAKAFEQEEVDHPEFSLIKPAGFLAPVDPADGMLFSAYSKEMGDGPLSRVRQATIEIDKLEGTSMDAVRENIRSDSAAVLSENVGMLDGHKWTDLVVERSSNEADVRTHYKLIASRDSIYRLAINVLPGSEAAFDAAVNSVLYSFVVK